MICQKCNKTDYILYKNSKFCTNCVQLYGLQNLELHDSYIKQLLRVRNIPIIPEMIELKRQQIKLNRKIKKLNKFNN